PLQHNLRALHTSQNNCAAILTRRRGCPMSHQPYMRLVYTSTRSAGAIGPACSIAMTCRCYDVPSVPWTNKELESRFRDTGQRLLRTTGQQGLTQCTLQHQGA